MTTPILYQKPRMYMANFYKGGGACPFPPKTERFTIFWLDSYDLASWRSQLHGHAI